MAFGPKDRAEWSRLCQINDLLGDEFLKAWESVQTKLASTRIPTSEELEALDKAQREWTEIRKQMNDFVHQHFKKN